MYRMVQRLTPQQVGVIARQLYIEMLKGGYTQVAEFHYLHNDISGKPYADRGEMTAHLSAAAGDVGIGLTLLPVLYSYAGFGGQPAQAGQKRFIQDADSYLEQQAIIGRQINGKPLQNRGCAFTPCVRLRLNKWSRCYAPVTRRCRSIFISPNSKKRLTTA